MRAERREKARRRGAARHGDERPALGHDERPEPWVYILPWELDKHMAKVAEDRKNKTDKPDDNDDYDDTNKWGRSDLIPDSWSNKS